MSSIDIDQISYEGGQEDAGEADEEDEQQADAQGGSLCAVRRWL